MQYPDNLRKVDELRAAIAAHGPMDAGVLKRINYKFRLEWNYTSNSMEGNTLTRAETRSVMIGNITVHGKPFKDVLEMKGHDETITTILKMGAGELNLSEGRIRDIHRAIMHEDDPEKAVLIGQWKTQDNYVINGRGERYDYRPHAEVPEAMHGLINWLSAEREKIVRSDAGALHPALLAFRFHLDYLSIHPFHDGNGRTARILTNIILIAYGYPPLWVGKGEREAYYQYLADVQAYGGSPDVLYDFMAGLLVRSQQLVLDAMEGREIEEPSDIDKEIALWKKSLSDEPDTVPKNNQDIFLRYTDSIKPLFQLFVKKHQQFAELFNDSFVVSFPDDKQGGKNLDYLEDAVQEAQRLQTMWDNDEQGGPSEEPYFDEFSAYYHFKQFRKAGTNAFGTSTGIVCRFGEYEWTVTNGASTISKLYTQLLTPAEIEHMIAATVKRTFEEIKNRMKPK